MNNIIHAHAPLCGSTRGNLSNSLITINDVKDKTVFKQHNTHSCSTMFFSTFGNLSNSLITINDVKDKTVFEYRFQLLLAIKIVAGQYKGNR